MSVARISCPQLLYVPLRPVEQSVDVEAVGVGGYLRRYPGSEPYQRLRQRSAETESSLEGRKADLHLLPRSRTPLRPFGYQHDAAVGEDLFEHLGAVGEIPAELAHRFAPEPGLIEQFLHQEHVRGAGGGELIGEGHAVGGADEVQL